MPNQRYYRAAARTIDRGWVQGKWYDEETGRVCMLQAVFDAMGLNGRASLQMPLSVLRELDSQLATLPSYCPTLGSKLRRVLALYSRSRLTSTIYSWNDSRGRTKQEVMGVLNALARRLELLDPEQEWMRGIIDRAIRPTAPPVVRRRQRVRP